MSDIIDDFVDEDGEFGGVVPITPRGRRSKTYEGLEIHSYQDAKSLFETVTADYARGEIAEKRARSIGYLCGNLLAYYKFDYERELLARIEKLEARMGESEKNK